MFHQSRRKIGYNISTIFIQMNLLTQRSKTFAMNYDKMNATVNTLVLNEREIRKAAEKNNKSPFSDKIRNEMKMLVLIH